MKSRTWLVFIFLTLGFLLLNKDALLSFFSQDDFFHLRIIMNKAFTDIPSFFVSWLDGQTFYRPLSREIFNLVMYKSFGLNPLPFHLVNTALIIFNSWLVFNLSSRLTNKNWQIGGLSATLYLLLALHNIELYYLASVQTLIATTFSTLAVIFYWDYKKHSQRRHFLLSLGCFLLALFSHESSLILPVILLGFELYNRDLHWKKTWPKLGLTLLPFVILGGLRFGLLLYMKGLPNQEVYTPIYSLRAVLNTLMWYVLWSFGLPEILVDFVGSGFKLNPHFYEWYGYYVRGAVPALLIVGGILVWVVVKSWKRLYKSGTIFIAGFAYLIAISPFLLFPQHKFIYYLSFASIWFAVGLGLILGSVLTNRVGKVLVVVFLVSFLAISVQTGLLNARTYWAAKRAKAAQFLLSDIKHKIPNLKTNQGVLIENDPNYPFIAKEWGSSSQQAFYILSGSDALRLLYKAPQLQVFYQDSPIQQTTPSGELVHYRAVFPY